MTMTNDEMLRQLAESPRLPEQALAHALLHVDELAPQFIRIVERAADDEIDSAEEASLFFFSVHVLGAGRKKAAYPAILRLIREGDAEQLDSLLGDAVTVTLPRILAGVYDGQSSDLFGILEKRDADPFLRWAIFGAVTFLAWEGRIDRGETAAFVKRFAEERLAGQDDLAWVGWFDAVGLLGLEESRPLAEKLWAEKWPPDDMIERETLEEQFARAKNDPPDDASRFVAEGLGYLDDLVADLSWIDMSDEEDEEEGGREQGRLSR